MEAVLNEQVQRAIGLISPYVEAEEAFWLKMYIPSVREFDEQLGLFEAVSGLPLQPEDLSYISNQAIEVYESSYSNRGEGMGLEQFARGAAALAVLLRSEDVDSFGVLLHQVMDRVDELKMYPALDERFVEDYVNCLEAVLENGEPMNRQELLAYNVGMWWAMGHVRGVDKSRIGRGRWAPTVWRFVKETWLDRASKGVID